MWTPEKVKALRKRYGETQEEFAERFRLSVESVRWWEQGKGPVGGPASVIMDQLAARIEDEPALAPSRD